MSDVSTSNSANSPLVTVITPAYNVGPYIGEAVDSVLGQTFKDFEYIVVDDGSSDDTADIVKKRTENDSRIRLVDGEHRGSSAVRNVGIRQAKGKYIAFLDGDDRWSAKFLERQVALIQSLPSEVGVVFCRSRMILENGTLIFVQWQRAGRYDFDDLLIGNNPTRNGSSLLIKKTCFDDVGLLNEEMKSAVDLEMWLRIADSSKTPIFWASKHFLVDLRLRPGSITRDRTGRQVAMDELLDSYSKKLRRSPAGLAYVRPAVAAFTYGYAGDDEKLAENWADKAKKVGVRSLLRDKAGFDLVFWSSLSPAQRNALRNAKSAARETVKKTILRFRPNP